MNLVLAVILVKFNETDNFEITKVDLLQCPINVHH